ncbi:MAG: BACON domain-containing protein, partial [Bacteroidales bacterium]
MKLKLFFYLSLILLLGCKSESPITESPVLEIALPDGLLVNLEKESSVTQIRINTNLEDWNASHETTEGNGWCDVQTIKSKGMENITLTVTENPGTAVRKTRLIVVGSGVEKQTIEVTQLGTDPVITANIVAQKLDKIEQEFAFE